MTFYIIIILVPTYKFDMKALSLYEFYSSFGVLFMIIVIVTDAEILSFSILIFIWELEK